MKIPSNASPQSQVLGSGFTTYFMVDSLEKVKFAFQETKLSKLIVAIDRPKRKCMNLVARQ